jgi:Putative addiction module component
MNKQSIRKNLHKYIDTIEDSNYLKVIHDLVSLKAEESSFELSAKEKAILDDRMEKHLSGESKSYTWEEVKKSLTSKKK